MVLVGSKGIPIFRVNNFELGHSISYKITCPPSNESDQPAQCTDVIALWAAKHSSFPYTDSGGSAKNMKLYRLTCISAWRTGNLVGDTMPCLKNILQYFQFLFDCNISPDKRGYLQNIFCISPRKYTLWVFIKAPHWGTSNEYSQHIFHAEIRKISALFQVEKMPYLTPRL